MDQSPSHHDVPANGPVIVAIAVVAGFYFLTVLFFGAGVLAGHESHPEAMVEHV